MVNDSTYCLTQTSSDERNYLTLANRISLPVTSEIDQSFFILNATSVGINVALTLIWDVMGSGSTIRQMG